MTTSDEFIDRIVANVLQQLGRPSSARVELAAPQVPTPSANSVLEIKDDVITAAILEERAPTAASILIGAKAVLTPSAREFLAKRGQAWSRTNGKHQPATENGRWLAIVARSTPAVESAIESLGRDGGASWNRELVGCHREAASRAIDALCRGDCDGAVALTARPEAVACLANRNPAVRAAAVATVARARCARDHMGANLFAVDPSQASAFELRQLLREIASGGKPAAPGDWRP